MALTPKVLLVLVVAVFTRCDVVLGARKAVHLHNHNKHGHHGHQVRKSEFHPHRELCPFGYGEGCGGGGKLSPAVTAQVAGVLKGILSNISSKKGFVEISKSLIHDFELHDTKNKEVKTALTSLMVAFQKDRKLTMEVVNKLTGDTHKNVAALASMSRILIRSQPLQQ